MKPTNLAASVLLGADSVFHLLRLLWRIPMTIAGSDVPMWVSGAATLVGGGLAVALWRSGRR